MELCLKSKLFLIKCEISICVNFTDFLREYLATNFLLTTAISRDADLHSLDGRNISDDWNFHKQKTGADAGAGESEAAE